MLPMFFSVANPFPKSIGMWLCSSHGLVAIILHFRVLVPQFNTPEWAMGLISKMRLWDGLKGGLSPFALEPNWFPAQMLGANSMCEVSFHMD